MGATFGFGGKLVVFGGIGAANAAAPSSVATVTSLVADAQLAASSDAFETALNSADFKGFCVANATACEATQGGDEGKHANDVWSYMRILFEDDSRQHLLQHLGFDQAAIAAELSSQTAAVRACVNGQATQALKRCPQPITAGL